MRAAWLALALLVAACGKIGTLHPVTPDRAPPRPNNVIVPPTPQQQLRLTPQEQPERVDDPLKRSQERRDDRFDLPPPGQR